jgi:hypothetical protein
MEANICDLSAMFNLIFSQISVTDVHSIVSTAFIQHAAAQALRRLHDVDAQCAARHHRLPQQ